MKLKRVFQITGGVGVGEMPRVVWEEEPSRAEILLQVGPHRVPGMSGAEVSRLLGRLWATQPQISY